MVRTGPRVKRGPPRGRKWRREAVRGGARDEREERSSPSLSLSLCPLVCGARARATVACAVEARAPGGARRWSLLSCAFVPFWSVRWVFEFRVSAGKKPQGGRRFLPSFLPLSLPLFFPPAPEAHFPARRPLHYAPSRALRTRSARLHLNGGADGHVRQPSRPERRREKTPTAARRALARALARVVGTRGASPPSNKQRGAPA